MAADWRRLGPRLGGAARSRAGNSLAGVRPALARAIGEAAQPQVHELYQASLDYGRATTPGAGLHYLSKRCAEGQADLGDVLPHACRRSFPTVARPAAARARPRR